MKFKKGEKVCAVIVANKWGVEFSCFVGVLESVERKPGSNPVVTMSTRRYIGLTTDQKYDKPTSQRIDAKVFKVMPWNDEVKAFVKELRDQSIKTHQMIERMYAYGNASRAD
jgi:hypothetical protein